jgi:HEAT repeat protein
VTPADVLLERQLDPFCANGVLATINKLADFSHSNAMAALVRSGKHRSELLITLGKTAPPRYANFIGRYWNDPDASVRQAVALALGLIDNEAVAAPTLIRLLARGDRADDFPVKWEAAAALAAIAKRKGGADVLRRLADLLHERNPMTVVLAARALAAAGDPRGIVKLRELTTHADPRVREEAVLALGDFGGAGSAEVVTRRLKDDSLAVRAVAVYALGRIRGPAAAPVLRQAVAESLEYEKELERRRARGESEQVLRERYGLGAYDLRETLHLATPAPPPPASPAPSLPPPR